MEKPNKAIIKIWIYYRQNNRANKLWRKGKIKKRVRCYGSNLLEIPHMRKATQKVIISELQVIKSETQWGKLVLQIFAYAIPFMSWNPKGHENSYIKEDIWKCFNVSWVAHREVKQRYGPSGKEWVKILCNGL